MTFLAENALFKDIGEVFHPLFELFGLILAGIYAVIPNYTVAITGLTIVIMLALTPVTVKSTKSMLAMQRLQPEMKKLQAKFKGPENREQLNAEMMKLYKENGTSPFGACLPSLLQMPFLIVLYSLIRGLSYGTLNSAGEVVKATPRYIPKGSQIYKNLVLNKGQMYTWFGTDLSKSPWTAFHDHEGFHLIPYIVLIVAAIFLQYYQMKQMNSRNPQAAAANPQMQQMQKFFPIIFGVIYLRVPLGAVIYMVVSSAMRIGTQDIMFRTGMVTPVATAEREIGGGAAEPKGGTPQKAIGTGKKPGTAKPTGGTAKPTGGTAKPAAGPAKSPGKSPNAAKRPAASNGKAQTTGKPGANGRAQSNQRRPTNGNSSAAARAGNGNNKSNDAEIEPVVVPKEHPRSRSKRTRKAR
jgi:YidC/Oxa1 family membrane protein insertase